MKSLLPLLVVLGLASRITAADFTVINTNSSGPGSLYQAITDANNTPGPDRILFNIRGSGVQKIDVSQNLLPAVSESLVIDGYSQPGAKLNTLTVGNNAVILIQIDGYDSSAPVATGLVFYGASSDYVVRGLCLTGFGIGANGVAITAGQVHSAVVTGNFIGLLPDGETPRRNRIGVGHVTQLGGTDPASRNVISGNSVGFAGDAAPAPGASVYGALVQGNYIGTNASGTKAIPNVEGIGLVSAFNDSQSPCNGTGSTDIDLSKTLIGGTASGARNVISGNTTGIKLGRFDLCSAKPVLSLPVRANGVRIQSNSIGLQSNGSALPNGSGIAIAAGSNNLIGGVSNDGTFAGNAIHYNGSGVIIIGGTSSQGNQISYNSIFQNQKLGIDLGGDGVTPNDVNDADSGPNNLQNYPLISSVKISTSPRSAIVSITGTLNSTPNSSFRLEFFINPAAGSSGFGEGEVRIGAINVITDASGNASFNTGFDTDPGRPVISATATDSSGNTSEFSPAFPRAAQLLNLSTRGPVGTGDNVLIGGFIVVGTENKQVMMRGLGPSLEDAGVSGVLADPTLELHDSKGALLAYNNDWKDSQADEIKATGLAPGKELESAILTSLVAKPASQGAAAYTGVLAGRGGTTGIGLLEVYDLAVDANSKLANISTRGYVGASDDLMIGGFIPGPADRSPTKLLIRALGPSLGGQGISGALQDPLLELRDGNGNVIARNDNWRDSLDAAQIAATGIPPGDDRESAILATLRPTASGYTALVRGATGATGVALVEVYALN